MTLFLPPIRSNNRFHCFHVRISISQDVTTRRLAMLLAGVVTLVLALIITAFYTKVCNESPIDAVALSFGTPAPKLVGVFAANKLLQSAEKLGVGKLPQAEDFVLDPTGQFFYVSTADGWVKKLRLKDGHVEDWKFVGGRPLGLALGRDGELIVCEPEHGLLKVGLLSRPPPPGFPPWN